MTPPSTHAALFRGPRLGNSRRRRADPVQETKISRTELRAAPGARPAPQPRPVPCRPLASCHGGIAVSTFHRFPGQAVGPGGKWPRLVLLTRAREEGSNSFTASKYRHSSIHNRPSSTSQHIKPPINCVSGPWAPHTFWMLSSAFQQAAAQEAAKGRGGSLLFDVEVSSSASRAHV